MINKLFRVAAKLLGKPINLENFKQSARCLCPVEEQAVAPAVYLEHHLLRVTGAHYMSSLDYEYACLNQKKVRHGATMLFSIGETTLFRGGLWTVKREVLTRRLSSNDEIFPINIQSAVMTDWDVTHQYFGHWLSEAVPASLIGNSEMQSIVFRKPHFLHASEYSDLFDLKTLFGNCGKVNNLYLLEDNAQNSYKVKRYLTLRARIEQKLKPINCAYAGVFMARGDSGVKRNLSNEQAVIDHLEKRGFDVVYPEKMSVTDLVKRLWNAPIVISVEGSALNHNIYSIALNGAYLILQPPHLFNNVHKGICDAMNRPYGFYVCHATQNPDEFYVDSMDDLDKIIDRLYNESAKRN